MQDDTSPSAGLDPIERASVDELRALQLEHLRENYPFGMFAVPREQVVRIHACGGCRRSPAAPTT